MLAAPPAVLLRPPALLTVRPRRDDAQDEGLGRRARRLAAIDPSATRLWIEAATGLAFFEVSHLDLARGAASFESRAVSFEASAGVRAQFFTVGLRTSHARFSHASVSTSGLVLGVRLSLGRFEPYLRAALGYAWEGGITERRSALVGGLSGGGRVGVACFVHRALSLHASFDTTFVAVAASEVSVDAADERSLREAQERVEKTAVGRLRVLQVGVAAHY